MSKHGLATTIFPFAFRYAHDLYYKNAQKKLQDQPKTMVKRKTPSSKKSFAKKGVGKAKKAYRARTYRTYARRKKSLRREIVSIKRTLRSDQARHTHRHRSASTIRLAGVNQTIRTAFDACRAAELESAMANLRYYDPNFPSTLVTADASSGSYTRQIHFETSYARLYVRNNYQVPVKIKIWSCEPKNDTSIAPTTFFSDGLTDQTTSLGATSPMINFWDIDMVKDNWRAAKTFTYDLNPGKEVSCVWAGKPFDFDPSNYDTHSLAYQKKYRAHVWVIQVEGVIMHDTTAFEYTTGLGGVDVLCDRKYVMTYDAGTNLNDFSGTNAASTSFTNGGVVSQVVVDNQQYSVS